jgi:hypothetical protein
MKSQVIRIFMLVVIATVMGCRNDRPADTVQTIQSAIAVDESTPIGKKWRELVNRGINLGEANAVVQSIPGGAAQYQTFASAAIVYSNDFGATYMPIAIFNRWLATQSQTDFYNRNLFFILGRPTQDYVSSPGHDECTFERGVIILVSGVARVVYGGIYLTYLDVAASIGLPLSEELPTIVSTDGRYQRFETGEIYWRPQPGAFAIVGAPTLDRFNAIGGAYGELGFPTTTTAPVLDASGVQIGVSTRFDRGVVYYSAATGAWEINQPILGDYEGRFGGPAGWLGFPIGPTSINAAADLFNDFQHGVLANRNGDPYAFGQMHFHLSKVVAYGGDCGSCGGQDLYYYVDVQSSERGHVVPNTRFPPDGDYDEGERSPGGSDWFVGTANSRLAVNGEIRIWDADFFNPVNPNDPLGSPNERYTIDNLWGATENGKHTDDFGYAEFNVYSTHPYDLNDPSQTWWSFHNFSTADLTWDQYAATFKDVGVNELHPEHPFNWAYFQFAYRGIARHGDCFGMTLESINAELGRSSWGEPIREYFPDTQDGRKLTEAPNWDGAHAALKDELNIKQGYQLGLDMALWAGTMWAHGHTHDPLYNFYESKRYADAGDYPLISVYDDAMFGKGHSLRPYRWKDDQPCVYGAFAGHMCAQLFVKDSNHPPTAMEPHPVDFIEIDKTLNRYFYYSFEVNEYSGGEHNGGRMFFQPYHTVSHQPVTPFSQPWLLTAEFYLMLVGGAGDTKQISDTAGRTFFESGLPDGGRKWSDMRLDDVRLPGVSPMMLVDASNDIQMWTGPAGGATHTYEVGALATALPGQPMHTTFVSGTLSSYIELAPTPAKPDRITLTEIGGANKAVTLAIPSSSVAKPVLWTVAGPEKQRWLEFSSMTMGPGQNIKMRMENAGRRVRINNSGPLTTASLRYQAGPGLGARNLGQVTIPVGESVIDPEAGCQTDFNCAAGQYCANGTCATRPCNLGDAFGGLVPVLPSGVNADGFALSADGKTAYVSNNPNGGTYDLFVTTRASINDPFGPLTSLSALNSWDDDRAPWLSQDGLRLYFFNKTLGNGSEDLVMASRASTAASFGGTQLVPNVNSNSDDADPFFLAGEQTLFFSSSRSGSRDLWTATRTLTGFTTPVQVGNVNSTHEDSRPVLTPDGLTLFFRSRRPSPSGDGDGDIWFATRASQAGQFGTPQNLSVLNTTGSEIPVAVSPDGCTLTFASNRETGLGGTTVHRLYRATRGQPPTPVTITMNIVGNGSVNTAPFACSTGNTGTCSAQLTAPASMILFGNRQGYWSGACRPNGAPGLSTDGVLTVTTSATCTVTFP